jgi:hypothetical protein
MEPAAEGSQQAMGSLLRVTDLRKLPQPDAKRKAGKVPVSEESEGRPISDCAPSVWSGRLGLFESVCMSGTGQTAARVESPWEHAAIFCGGPIWGLDWLGEAKIFQDEGEGEDHQIVAVACMANGCHEVTYGAPVQGQTHVQVPHHFVSLRHRSRIRVYQSPHVRAFFCMYVCMQACTHACIFLRVHEI